MPPARALRLALFGSPAFALPMLEALRRHHRLELVVTQPDKPAGRGMRLTPPPAARRARELGIELAQPTRLKRDAAFHERLAALDLDVAITAAYGKILPESLLRVPRHGFLNVHASLLPRYRGAAPVQWALIRGERETGVTIMQTEAGLDTGPIRHQRSLPIGPHETAPELFERLAALGVEALLEALEKLARDALPCEPQDHDAATLAPLLSREDGALRWERPAQDSYNRYRGVFAWPGTTFEHGERSVKVREMRPADAAPGDAGTAPGTVLAVSAPRAGEPDSRGGVLVACGAGALRLITVQPAGRPAMAAGAWAQGYGVEPGVRLA